MTTRSFRLRLTAPSGQHLSQPYFQNKGVPQGGSVIPSHVASLVDQMPGTSIGIMSAAAPEMAIDTELLLRVFGDYVAAVASGNGREGATRQAHLLVEILQEVLNGPGLFRSLAKCKNFLIQQRRY